VWRGRQFVERLTPFDSWFDGKVGVAVVEALFSMETH
jgi:hypothetical protein